MKKGISFVRDEACQKAFKDIKEYLTKSPVLVATVWRKPFLLYIRAMDHSLVTLLEYLLAIVTHLYSVFWEAGRDNTCAKQIFRLVIQDLTPRWLYQISGA